MISPMLLSEVVLPRGHPRVGSPCPVFGFVIHHADGPVLVDTGVGFGNEQIDAVYTPVHHSIDEALQRVGVERAEVAMVINSHLHFDHCGNNRLFPGVPVVVQQAEYELAAQPGYTIADWIDFPGIAWEVVDGEAEVMEGITVMPTPGHTPGHQSVLVTSDRGIDLIAAQAVYDAAELDAEVSAEPLSEAKAAATSASARRIKAVNPLRVFFSHDSRIWPT